MTLFSGQKRIHRFAFVFLSAILLSAGWPAAGFAPLLLFAFVPLLLLENYFYENRSVVKHKGLFFYSFLCFLCWNLLTTWWIYYATSFGAAAAIFFNTLFMATVFSLFHKARCRLGNRYGYASFILFWTGFEYLHLNWDLSWPWLTLGNGFASFPQLIQWYEFTGILGGSVWILLTNTLVFLLLKAAFNPASSKKMLSKLFSFTAIVILIPVVVSEIRYYSYAEKSHPVKIAVTQPNIDPYNEKFNSMSSAKQLDIMLTLGKTVLDSTTDYLVGPETSLPFSIWEDRLPTNPDIKTILAFLKNYPQLQVVTGLATNKLYPTAPANKTARKFRDSPEYYDSYNTAMQINKEGDIQLYHKSQLVIGVEKIPYPQLFGLFEKFAIDLGGASGSLGTQEEPSVFNSPKGIKIAPAICYESIYGAYMAWYIKKGAQLIFIVTNDGWWGDTPGYRQHLQYARLRAIENRRSIARSANTGISAFINQRGDITAQTKWWEPVAIQQSINANDELTFYTRFGDFAGILSAGLSCILLVITFVKKRPA